eukprot:scaffold536584_cov38-Prasinocladus_malaysianus.AAC.1
MRAPPQRPLPGLLPADHPQQHGKAQPREARGRPPPGLASQPAASTAAAGAVHGQRAGCWLLPA